MTSFLIDIYWLIDAYILTCMNFVNKLLQSRTLTLKNIFAKLKFSSALFKKMQLFVCLVFKIENKWILKLQNLFS